MWALLAMAALSVGGSLLKGKDEARAARARNVQVEKANLANAVNTAHSVSTLKAQATLFQDQAANARAAAERQALSGASGAEAQAASAGVRGASVDAVISDIDRELGWANANLERTVDIEAFNMQTRLRSLISGAQANVYGYTPVQSTNSIMSDAVVQAGMEAGSTYANSYFKFGAA